MKKHILVLDDDLRIRDLLGKFLQKNGFFTSSAKSAEEALELLQYFSFDLAIFDVMLPGISGTELTKKIRETLALPIIMLSAMSEVSNRIEGLKLGADDYLCKPFEPEELLLRIHNLLSRIPNKKGTDIIKFGEFELNIVNNQLFKSGEKIHLTSAEAELLRNLATQLGKPISREELAKKMNIANERTIDVQITRLRSKINGNDYIKAIRGKGYVLYQ